jgi:hypothetical protein
MKRCSTSMVTFFLAVLGGLTSSQGVAQQPNMDDSTKADLAKAESAFVVAEFTGSLNGRKLKPGAKVKAEVAQDVLAHGKIIIPADAKLVGHVTEVRTRGSDRASRLGIIFDKVLLKHHVEKVLQGVVYALAPPTMRTSKVDEPDQMMMPAISMGGPAPSRSGGRSAPSRPGSPTVFSGDPFSSNAAPVVSYNEGNNLAARAMAPPIGIGTRPGVYGMKGVSLTTGGSTDTPGPVILSTAPNVKLDYRTQVVVKVKDLRTLQ